MKILYAEDNAMDADLLRHNFARTNPHFKIERVATYSGALARLKLCTVEKPIYDIVLTDMKLPDGSGLSLLSLIRERGIPLPVVVLTGAGREETAVAALKAGANDYVIKGGDYLDRLPLILENALNRYQKEKDRFARPIRVLYAERSAVDIDLTERHMNQYAPHIHLDFVKTAEEVLQRYPLPERVLKKDEQVYDVILLDYLLPDKNALTLLKELQETRRPNMSVVVITGQGNEDIAFQALRLGAMDYVVKNSGYLFHLPAVIENVYRQAQMIQAQKVLKEREVFYRSLIENVSDIISVFNVEGTIQFLSPSLERILGYKPEEILGRKWADLIHPEDLPGARKTLEQLVLKSGETLSTEMRIRHKDGSWHDMESLSKGLVDELGNVTLTASLRDITERKRAEEALRVSVEEFSKLFHSSPDAILLTKLKSGKIINVNNSFEKYSGYSGDELIGHPVIEFNMYSPNDRQKFVTIVQEQRGIRDVEFTLKNKAGKELLVLASAELIQINEEPHILTILHDITERKQSEQALRESEEKYRLLAENVTDVIWTLSLESMRFTYVSPSVLQMGGYTSQEIMELTLDQRISPESLEQLMKILREELAKEKEEGVDLKRSRTLEIKQLNKDGTYGWVEVTVTFIRNAENRPIAVLGVTRDITERKRAGVALHRSEEKFFKAFQANPSLMAIRSLKDGLFIDVNDAYIDVMLYSREELIGADSRTLGIIDSETDKRVSEMLRKQGFIRDQEVNIKTKTGDIRIGLFSAVVIEIDGEPCLLTAFQDITERKQSEQALQKSEEKYRNILESIEEGYYEVDLAGNLTFFNDSVCQMLGYSQNELMGMNDREYTDETNSRELYRVFNEVFRTGKPAKTFEWQVIRKDGTEGFGEMSVSLMKDMDGRPIGFRGIVRDVTNRKMAEQEKQNLWAQLQQAQKMEAIGTLAGGIAHDFNNILTVILGCTELVLMKIPDQNSIHRHLTQILQASERAKDLVKQILAFSRQIEQERKPIQPGIIVKEALKMLRSSLPSTIEIQQYIQKDQDQVIADPTQIHQIMMNLCTNAAHAMREEGGILKVSLTNFQVATEMAEQNKDLIPGPYVHLTVSDTGHGMTPEVRERIFDPYFTTKAVGEGTGLGLAVVYGIVRSYKGSVKVHSEPGKGSTFEIFLPQMEYAENGSKTDKSEPVPGGIERILLVDDEETLVYTFQHLLKGLGYQVTAKTSSLEALETFRTSPDEFDVIITDMTMPHLTGTELSRRIKQIRTDIPIILFSGYSEMIDNEKAKNLGIQAFLMKPILRRELAETLRKVLDRKDEG